jgi:hypothetical protein
MGEAKDGALDVLLVGEDLRLIPSSVDFADWMRPAVLQLAGSDVTFPVSFDRAVWPRPEDMDPAWTSPKGRNILELMPLRPCATDRENVCRIAVGLATFNGPLTMAIRDAHNGAIGPDDITTWRFLGFDVLDSGLAMSGVLNFGDSSLSLASDVLVTSSEKLNRLLLWPSLESAKRFAEQMTSLITEHGPFEVVALFGCGSWCLPTP